MKHLLALVEKLLVFLKPTYIGYVLAFVAFFFALNFLAKSKELNAQLSGLSQELLERKSAVERLESELAQNTQKIQQMEAQASAATDKATQDQTKIETLDIISKKHGELLSVLEAPKLKIISLITPDTKTKANGKFFWNPDLKTAFVLVTGLDSNPDSTEYQFWMVQKGAVNLNLISFTVDSAETKIFNLAELPITDPKKLSSVLITREPKGGSSRPSGTKILSGKL